MVEIAPGMYANLYLLAPIGLGLGLISGFAGVSGGYLLTPVLIILGFPAPVAVGTGLGLMAPNTLIGLIRHKQLGHLDLKMGVIMAAGALLGAEAGVRLLHGVQALNPQWADTSVLLGMLAALAVVAVPMVREVRRSSLQLAQICDSDAAEAAGEIETAACRFLQGLCIFPHIRFTKSKLRISGWIVFGLGVFVGLLSGFLGVGGGFISNPALIYLVGQPSLMAVGTNLVVAFVGTAFSCFRHAMLGHVDLPVSMVMLLGMALGTYVGAQGTAYVRGIAVRYVLVTSVLAAMIGPSLKLAWLVTGSRLAWLDLAARFMSVAQIILPVTVVVVMLIMAVRYRRGRVVPAWAAALMAIKPHYSVG